MSTRASTDEATTNDLPLPPLVPGLPVVGNAPALTRDLVSFILEQYKRFGPIFRVKAFNQEIVVLAGPEANTFVTQEGGDKFSSKEAWTSYGQEFGVDVQMQNIDGEPHLRMRKLLKPAYSVGSLLSDIPLLVEIEQNVLDKTPINAKVPALSLFRLIVTEQIGRMLTNHAPGEDLESLISVIRTSLKVHVNHTTPSFLLRLPAYQSAKKRVLRLGDMLVSEHQASKREKPDLVDVLLDAHKDERYADVLGGAAQLRYAATGPFVAGLDTVANECTFMLYALLNHPHILAQCVEEADQLFSNGIPTLAQVKDADVLRRTTQETLRLHSIAPVVARTAAKTFAFAGHRVQQGQSVIIGTTVSHFLPHLYPDPYTFDIGRYTEDRKEHKQRGAYVPFGIGTHLCLGAGAAESQIVLVMAALLHMASIEWADPGKKLPIKNDPTPTYGPAFRVRITSRRHTPTTPTPT